MGVVIGLPLFGPPGRELEDGETIDGPRLRQAGRGASPTAGAGSRHPGSACGRRLDARLGQYDAILDHPEVETPDEAARRLQTLGIAPEDLLIFEEAEDEEDT